jgi:C4-dicarboxylate transporter DctM subunit
MSAPLLTLMIFAIMLVLMALRTPIAIAMFVAGTVGYVMQAGWLPLASFLNTQAFARFASYDLSVIPLFILMGNFRHAGRHLAGAVRVRGRGDGRFKGGLAMAAVLACAAFGAICGSSVATAATITSVALPEMKRHGYSGRLATGTLAAGGTLGILIPPSVPLVIYAILAEQNIAKLFAAAMVPGLIADAGLHDRHRASMCAWCPARPRVDGGRRGSHLRGGAAQARNHLARSSSTASMPRPRARR